MYHNGNTQPTPPTRIPRTRILLTTRIKYQLASIERGDVASGDGGGGSDPQGGKAGAGVVRRDSLQFVKAAVCSASHFHAMFTRQL